MLLLWHGHLVITAASHIAPGDIQPNTSAMRCSWAIRLLRTTTLVMFLLLCLVLVEMRGGRGARRGARGSIGAMGGHYPRVRVSKERAAITTSFFLAKKRIRNPMGELTSKEEEYIVERPIRKIFYTRRR
ncbi:hypothetical protein BIW11_09251 [Tropilaelaps mercedesae]|uniref:Uncharacterized protein n=1 Tax=Tropilaelaps mercedesae TaxID=418985 RepID=A0A1V9XKW8_9ACAR|nr:hypothetical protein BIW11_09251 [Tropilaelaps mercedesae]